MVEYELAISLILIGLVRLRGNGTPAPERGLSDYREEADGRAVRRSRLKVVLVLVVVVVVVRVCCCCSLLALSPSV